MVEWTRVHQLERDIIEAFDKGLYNDIKGVFIPIHWNRNLSVLKLQEVLTNKNNGSLKRNII